MKTILTLFSGLVFSLVGISAHGQLDGETFATLQAQLQPNQDESWRQIPWKISVLEAQQVAAREQKPLFIWAMDGHPLGCT